MENPTDTIRQLLEIMQQLRDAGPLWILGDSLEDRNRLSFFAFLVHFYGSILDQIWLNYNTTK